MIETSKRVPVGATAAVMFLLLAAVAGALLFGSGGPGTATAAASVAAPPEPVEVTGRWRGMELVGTQSPQAQAAGVPANADGVLVLALPENDPRARRAGLMPGDLVVGVDGADVIDIGDLLDATKQIDAQRAVSIDIVRQGQPLTLVLPPIDGGPTAVPGRDAPDPDAMRFVCPQDGSTWFGEQVAPAYRCFRCGGPLTRAR